jgi:drug/metabolite transporter (DMT)-like permease
VSSPRCSTATTVGSARKQTRRERAIGVACALLVVVLFSSFTLVSRLGLTASSLSVPDLAAMRFGVGGLVLLPVLLWHGPAGGTWRGAAAMAFLGGLGFALFAYTGFTLAPAAHGAVLLHGTLPLFTAAIAAATSAGLDRRRFTDVALVGLGIALMAADSFGGATARQLLGDLCLLLASFCWSAYGVLARRLGVAPARAAATIAALSAAVYLPIYALWPGKALSQAGLNELLGQAVFQGVLIGVVSIFVYTRAVKALGAAETALFTAAVPPVTTLAAVPLLGELPSPLAILGVVVVTSGMLVGLLRGRRA